MIKKQENQITEKTNFTIKSGIPNSNSGMAILT